MKSTEATAELKPDQPVADEVKAAIVSPAETPGHVKKPKSDKLVRRLINKIPYHHWVLLGLVVAVLLVASSIGAHYYYKANPTKTVIPSTTSTVTNSVASNGTSNSTTNSTTLPAGKLATPTVTLTGDSYFTTPKELADLNFWADTADEFGDDCSGPTGTTDCAPQVLPTDISYYQIGYTAAGQPIVVASDYDAGESDFAYVALETSTNQYAILAKMNDQFTGSTSDVQTAIASFTKYLNSNVTMDTTSVLSGLTFPTSATVSGMAVTEAMPGSNGYFLPSMAYIRGTYFTQDGTTTPAMTAFGQSDNKTFYDVTAEDSDNYQVKEIYATVNQVFANSYQPVDPLNSSTSAPKITWSDGAINKTVYTYESAGCGSSSGYMIAKNITPDELTVVGTGPQNQTIYALDTNAPLFNEIYTTDYSGGTYLNNKELENLTVDQFQAAHAFFLAQNSLGEYVIYERTDMFIFGGCGKPVIYLYPPQTTAVNVAVGANIVKADPLYPSSGWRNVIAQPNGQLTYAGKTYNSLYWEGTGLGIYPAITAGTIVKSSQAVSTIKTQLTEQGLKPSEIADFLSFWAPKLPNTPYVRLTWFNTTQMNNLAPLLISPKPTTLIRTFLDFQGLDQPISLPAQSFYAPNRQGFTVVEWGGLLSDLK